MEKGKKGKHEFSNLRHRAEARAANLIEFSDSQASTDKIRQIHELEVHRLELALLNEELRQVKAELAANYRELYVRAPVGFFFFGRFGDIEKTNLTGASILGQPRAELLGRRVADYVEPESLPSFNEFLRRVMGGSRKESCMVTLMKGGNA